LVLYAVGGTINHTLHVLVHDFTHYSGHPNILVNKAFAIFCNISMGIPSAISFGLYHSDHHNFMGEREKDPDLPTNFEIKIFDNKILKALFFIFLSPIYALRPFILMHKKMTPAEIINFTIVICSNLLVAKFWGFQAFICLFFGGVFSLGGHPAAVHVIAEHH
jgi:sphingolipid delta-4 desaturase